MIEIYDNFLDDISFKKIEKEIMSSPFLWAWCNNTVTPKEYQNKYDGGGGVGLEEDHLDNYQMYHMIYNNCEPTSPTYKSLDPLLKKLEAVSILKIKANLNPRTSKIIEHGFHTDMEYKCYTGIFYLNTCDGYTVFENGKKVESVANRYIEFDSHLMHSGTSTTDSKRRVVINFNYITKDILDENASNN
tara:strand:+ start:185 stop:751 length:567 start_codon:yes stop_codon:yes gene_type:complete